MTTKIIVTIRRDYQNLQYIFKALGVARSHLFTPATIVYTQFRVTSHS
ncbi:MAG: hypothetical protein HWQ38_00560 [Nostoc sp. NMS7]|nr:hypothetical protein [Nostoc sp. NMS7]MBN3945053.1 hypothetical protein [Nostoc sp. NMS7]